MRPSSWIIQRRPNRRWSIAIVIAAGATAGGIAWLRLSRVTAESDPTVYWAREGERAFAQFSNAAIAEREAITKAIATAPVDDGGQLLQSRPELLSGLREAATEFVLARYSVEGAADYIAWMEAHGYRFKSADEFSSAYGPLSAQAARAGITGTDPAEIFLAMWDHGPSRRASPNGICVSPEAIAIVIGETNRQRPFTGELSGQLGYDLWHGGGIANCRFWMRPPVARETIVEARGRVVAAQVGLIVTGKGSTRRPVILGLFLDPAKERWWVDRVWVTNHISREDEWDCTEY